MNQSPVTPVSQRFAVTSLLWIWLTLGMFAFACIPALRARDPFWGWLPFWLIVAPAIDLVLLGRAALVAASRALLVRARRRRRAAPRQARRVARCRSWQTAGAQRAPNSSDRRGASARLQIPSLRLVP